MANIPLSSDPAKAYSDARFLRTFFNGFFFCNLCNHRSGTDDEWQCHYTDDHTEKSICVCPIGNCANTYIYFCELVEHIIQDHQKTDICCYICELIYRNPLELIHHVQNVHSTRNEQQRDLEQRRPLAFLGLPQFKCDKCEFVIGAILRLFEHYRLTHIQYLCFICDVVCFCLSVLKLHIRRIHYARDKRYKCGICNAMFVTVYAFDHHCSINHQLTRYRCAICDISFPLQRRFIRHCRSAHRPRNMVLNI